MNEQSQIEKTELAISITEIEKSVHRIESQLGKFTDSEEEVLTKIASQDGHLFNQRLQNLKTNLTLEKNVSFHH